MRGSGHGVVECIELFLELFQKCSFYCVDCLFYFDINAWFIMLMCIFILNIIFIAYLSTIRCIKR